MTHPDDQHRLPLAETAVAAHTRARAALVSPDDRVMDAVVWLSAHLTAMEHVVYPFVSTHLPLKRKQLDEQRRLTRRMHRTLRSLEQQWAGDGLAPPDANDHLRSQLLALLDKHEQGERALLGFVSDITDDAALNLAERYDHAIGHGPTRPHPHGPHRGRLGRLTYAFDAARDHILDVLDSRHVPLPLPQARTQAGGQSTSRRQR